MNPTAPSTLNSLPGPDDKHRNGEPDFAAIFKQAASGIAQINLSGRPTVINDRFCEIVGRSREDLLTMRIRDFTHPDDLPRNMEYLRAALEEGRPYAMDKRYLRPDGSAVWVSIDVSAMLDAHGKPTGLIGICQDITERKQTEQLLREQKNLLELAASGRGLDESLTELCAAMSRLNPRLRAYIHVVDPQDPALRHAFAAQLPSSRMTAFKAGALHELAHGACAEAVRFGRPAASADIARDERWPKAWRDSCLAHGVLGCHCAPVIGTEGATLASIMLCFDEAREVTESELRLADFGTHMASIVIERDRSERKLRDADRRKDEFLATLAHELRNPLAPICNGLELLRVTGHEPALNADIHATMARQARLMVRLVDDLLDVSRITRGHIELRKSEVDLGAIIAGAVETAQPAIEARNHRLTVSLPESPLTFTADPSRLTQVIANLLNNAAKFMEAPGTIAIAARRDDDRLVVSVRDSGIGIPSDMLDRIFDLFTQLDYSLERSHGGLGIGLTLVKQIVEMHGGTIEARSEGIDCGSEFIIRLPLDCEKTAKSAPWVGASAAAIPRRVLVVDDNESAARTLHLLLEVGGHDVLSVVDALQAVEVAETFRPDVVLLDLSMPKLNGYEVARRIRAAPWGADALLVALSGWGQEEDRRLTREAGFDQHLVKPVKATELQRLLSRSVRHPSPAEFGLHPS